MSKELQFYIVEKTYDPVQIIVYNPKGTCAVLNPSDIIDVYMGDGHTKRFILNGRSCVIVPRPYGFAHRQVMEDLSYSYSAFTKTPPAAW